MISYSSFNAQVGCYPTWEVIAVQEPTGLKKAKGIPARPSSHCTRWKLGMLFLWEERGFPDQVWAHSWQTSFYEEPPETK